tara:strand:- start:550 stop:1242 length:693 start_codon:yes stop_codon:yes gene_type:complete
MSGQIAGRTDRWESPDLSPEIVEPLALVLAGLDPAILRPNSDNSKSRPRTRNIHELRCDNSLHRISPTRSLANDHRCVLWPCFRQSEKAFAEMWQNSRTVAGAQDATVLIKQVQWLKKMRLTASDHSLALATESIDTLELVKTSPKILFYLFRNAIRHLDRDCSHPVPVPSTPSLGNRLMQKFSKQSQPATPVVYFAPSILRETESYLETSLKLGRMLDFASRKLRRERA